MATRALPYDLISKIIEVLSMGSDSDSVQLQAPQRFSFESQPDYKTICRCALANREIHQLAAKVLYSRVTVLFNPYGTLREPAQFTSACLPQYGGYVLSLEVMGYPSARRSPPGSPSTLDPDILISAIQRSFRNLRRLVLAPTRMATSAFMKIIGAIPKTLEEISVNSVSLADDPSRDANNEIIPTRSTVLTKIEGLRILTLVDPNRAILQVLSDWLEKLSRSLVELYLQGNCGSITPGVLRSFIAPLQCSNVHSLTLSVSYSIADGDLFSFLSHLPQLSVIQVHYYLQLNQPSAIPSFPSLRSLTVTYTHDFDHDTAMRFCNWINRIIQSAPLLESLCISDPRHSLPDEDPEEDVKFDSLVNHLVEEHSANLRILDLGRAYVGIDSLRRMWTSCLSLEVLRVGADSTVLTEFTLSATEMASLHTASFIVRGLTLSEELSMQRNEQLVTQTMEAVLPLRRLYINGVQWEGSWVSDGQAVKFVISTTSFKLKTRTIRIPES